MQKEYETSGGVLFEEKQSFPRWILLLLISPVLITLTVTLAVGYSEPSKGKDVWIALVIVIPVESIMAIVFYTLKLEKIVTTAGLYFRWTPWQKKYRLIEKQEIETMELRRSPSMKYGSNYVPGYGRSHNVSNGDGMRLVLRNGKKIFFGTADQTGFRRAMEEMNPVNSKKSWREF